MPNTQARTAGIPQGIIIALVSILPMMAVITLMPVVPTLRNHFKDNIRILSSIGQFSYILKIRADQYDVSLTLQLDSKYSFIF